jgi:hypothetical protein
VRACVTTLSIVGALVATLLAACPSPTNTHHSVTETALNDLGLTTHLLENWELRASRVDPKGQWRTATFTKSGSTIRIRVLSPFNRAQFARFRAEQDSLLQGLFKARPASYPGLLTNEIECPSSFKPKRVELDESDVTYSLFAGDRLNFGGCGEDVLVYRAGLRFLYCDGHHSAVRIEAFVPKEESSTIADRLVRSFEC